ncbi:MAG: ankyrin repeat domain-containing protein [Candidatus Wallbacteria bacterium]|nr:ankyrin repeat domain-containing protein [Candidatus Wallbacteria bacterium]
MLLFLSSLCFGGSSQSSNDSREIVLLSDTSEAERIGSTQEILTAFLENNATKFAELLKTPLLVNVCQPLLPQLAYLAAGSGEIQMLECLLNAGCSVEIINCAFDSGQRVKNPDVLKYLLKRPEFPLSDFSMSKHENLYALLRESGDEELLMLMAAKGSLQLHPDILPAVKSVALARQLKLETWDKRLDVESPLCFVRNPEVAQYLIDCGHSPDHGEFPGQRPLAMTQSVDVAEVLIRNGAKFKSAPPVSMWGWEILTNVQKKEIAELLISLGCRYDFQDDWGEYPIHEAGISTTVLNLLLDKGMSPDLLDKKGLTPLFFFTDSVEKAGILLDHGADPFCRTPVQGSLKVEQEKTGYTLLHRSLRGDFVRLMVKHGLDPNLRGGEHNETPLHCATRLEVIEALISAGADVNARDDLGRTPLFNSLLGTEEIKFLLDKGADASAVDKDGHGILEFQPSPAQQELLRSAGAKGISCPLQKNRTVITDPLTFKKVLENGGDILAPFDFSSEKDGFSKHFEGQLPLLVLLEWRSLGVSSGQVDPQDRTYLDLIREFLDKGGDPKIKGKQGRNILELYPCLEVARMLEKKGFDPAKDITRLLERAVNEPANSEFIQYLLDKGGPGLKEAARYVAGRSNEIKNLTLLMDCLPEYVEMLTKFGIPINAADSEGRTALHYDVGRCGGSAAYSLKKVNSLLAAGADPRILDKSGNTVLHEAVSAFFHMWRDDGGGHDQSGYKIFLDLLKILKEAGSNPALKNKAGETALDVLNKKCLEKGFAGEKIEVIKKTLE